MPYEWLANALIFGSERRDVSRLQLAISVASPSIMHTL